MEDNFNKDFTEILKFNQRLIPLSFYSYPIEQKVNDKLNV